MDVSLVRASRSRIVRAVPRSSSAAADREVEFLFILENVGPRPAEIKQITASCSCARHTLSNDYIRAGGSVDLRATIDLRGEPVRAAQFIIQFGEKVIPRVMLLEAVAQME